MSATAGSPPDSTSPPDTSGGTSNATGRGYQGRSGRHGRGGRGRGYQGRGGRTGSRGPPATATFKGDTADMNGHVYQTFNENDDKRQFGKTTEALGRWINMHTKNSGDLVVLHTDLQDPVIEKPAPLSEADKDEPIEQLLWKETVKDFITRKRSLVDNLRAVYSVIWGQCSPTMKAKLMSVKDYETQSRACNCVWILREIKGVMYKFEGQRDIFLAMGEARSTLD
jgi:hypothetical protein